MRESKEKFPMKLRNKEGLLAEGTSITGTQNMEEFTRKFGEIMGKSAVWLVARSTEEIFA